MSKRSTVLALEELLLRAANGQEFSNEVNEYKKDFYFSQLQTQLLILPQVIKQSSKKVTVIRTISEAMESERVHKKLLPEVHRLIRLYFTVPVTTSTSERAFSALKRLLTYLRSTMTEERLNNCFLMHVHKDITDTMDSNEIAKNFVMIAGSILGPFSVYKQRFCDCIPSAR